MTQAVPDWEDYEIPQLPAKERMEMDVAELVEEYNKIRNAPGPAGEDLRHELYEKIQAAKKSMAMDRWETSPYGK
jgi:hypothetical protein